MGVIKMIYSKLTVKAMKIAYDVHQGQTDKTGVPYIFHPYHLAEQMDDEISVCVALLHDVVEDSDVTFEDLEKSFPEEVIAALKLLTHQQGTDYYEYINHIKTNELAKKVKLADLAHNLDETRFVDGVNEETLKYIRNKYQKAKAILTAQ